MKIHRLDAAAADGARTQLVDLLLDAVANGASMGFPAGLRPGDADHYWQGVSAQLGAGSRVLLAASHEGTLAGAVQLDLCQGADGGDRAEVQTMMVHSRVRRRGIGSVLLRASEAEALALGRRLLFLDLEAGSGAEQLYQWLGYTRAGQVSGEVRNVYYKTLLSAELA
jgi:acetyltransferase